MGEEYTQVQLDSSRASTTQTTTEGSQNEDQLLVRMKFEEKSVNTIELPYDELEYTEKTKGQLRIEQFMKEERTDTRPQGEQLHLQGLELLK